MRSRRPVTFSPEDFLGALSLEDADLPFEEEGVTDAELPTYSGPSSSRRGGGRSRRIRTEHIYTINNADGTPWLYLKLKSWASSANSLPLFIEGQTIKGDVDLDLKKSDSISAIVVNLVGRVEFSRIDHKTFLTVSETVWDTSKGDPHSPGLTQKPYSKKLQGNYSWSFALNLPKQVYRTAKHSKILALSPIEKLPPYFDGKGWRPSIQYELNLDIKRSGPFRLGSTLSTLIAYTPCITPDPPSPLRQLAYEEKTTIPGPEVDPAGWKVFPEVTMHGTIFNNRQVSVSCTLAFATPLTYTRGSAVPLALILRGEDKQALDLLANPEAPVVRMRRKMNAPIGVDDEAVGCSQPGAEGYRPICRAGWWHSDDFLDESDSTKRTLRGELSIPPHLTPSFKFGGFELWYAVDMFPFKISGFASSTTDRLFRTDIKIATNYPRGPKPTAHLPPGYISVAKRDSGVQHVNIPSS